MDIDHIFIFTHNNGRIANDLVAFGLTEGSSRVHQGQGTTNRTFPFENFYLEIAWVHNEQEIKSELVKPTGLWQRAEFKTTRYSPFGLVFRNHEETDPLFENAYQYQPEYFSSGMTFDILSNESCPGLPWTCRMPFKKEKDKKSHSIKHTNGLSLLTKVNFQVHGIMDDRFLSFFKKTTNIAFIKSDKPWLTLTFDHGRQQLKKKFEILKLTVEY